MLNAEFNDGKTWRFIGVAEALLRPSTIFRCAVCRQRVVAYGSFRPGAAPHFGHYRMQRACAHSVASEKRHDAA